MQNRQWTQRNKADLFRWGETLLVRIILTGVMAFGAMSAFAEDIWLEPEALVPFGPLGWIAPTIVPPPVDPALPVVAASADDPGAILLRSLAARGRIAGFDGVIYDNRDRGHSELPAAMFPGLSHLRYGPVLRDETLDQGLGAAIVYPAIVLGNASMAVTQGAAPRSLPRAAMTQDNWPDRSFRSYVTNHIYVYPEHLDHDAVDLFPAQWPYMVISQGSSGSDQPFLQALAMTLASFAPDTRDKLQAAGLIAPTVQMILRRSLKTIRMRETYLSAAAHPTVFDASQLAPERMVALAAAMRPETIPPMVRLAVEVEDFASAAGLGGLSERLFDTPSAIARIWRSTAWEKRIVVSAAQTRDPNGHDLQFTWVLLRGDPARVQIAPLDPAGTRAQIMLQWQDARPIVAFGNGPARISSRVDVGVFAWNGTYDSAPAILSVSFPTHEVRHYAPDADGLMQLRDIDYDAVGREAEFDPLLHWSAPWRDIYRDDGNHTTGWWRETGSESRYLGETSDIAGAQYHLVQQGRDMILNEGPAPGSE